MYIGNSQPLDRRNDGPRAASRADRSTRTVLGAALRARPTRPRPQPSKIPHNTHRCPSEFVARNSLPFPPVSFGPRRPAAGARTGLDRTARPLFRAARGCVWGGRAPDPPPTTTAAARADGRDGRRGPRGCRPLFRNVWFRWNARRDRQRKGFRPLKGRKLVRIFLTLHGRVGGPGRGRG